MTMDLPFLFPSAIHFGCAYFDAAVCHTYVENCGVFLERCPFHRGTSFLKSTSLGLAQSTFSRMRTPYSLPLCSPSDIPTVFGSLCPHPLTISMEESQAPVLKATLPHLVLGGVVAPSHSLVAGLGAWECMGCARSGSGEGRLGLELCIVENKECGLFLWAAPWCKANAREH